MFGIIITGGTLLHTYLTDSILVDISVQYALKRCTAYLPNSPVKTTAIAEKEELKKHAPFLGVFYAVFVLSIGFVLVRRAACFSI